MSADSDFVPRPAVRYSQRDRRAVVEKLIETATNGKACSFTSTEYGTAQQFRQSLQVMLARRGYRLHCIKQGEASYTAWAERVTTN